MVNNPVASGTRTTRAVAGPEAPIDVLVPPDWSDAEAPQGALRLPLPLVLSAATRLAWLSICIAVLFVSLASLQYVMQPQLAPVLLDPVSWLAALVVVLMALSLFVLQRSGLVAAATILALGMVFDVVVAFAIAIIETAWPISSTAPLLGVSTLGPWIFAVGTLIPNRPIWTLVTALAAATTWPLAYAINYVRLDFVLPPWGTLVAWPAINFMLAGLTFLIGRRLYGTAIAAQNAMELGSYRLVGRIGSGGMGEVWKASHRMLARPAAIKLIRSERLAGGSARQAELAIRRFRREAEVVAGLQSPHTVYLYDFGVARDGRLYCVMELLDGITLQDLVARFGPQPASRVAAILGQVCESLEEAHQRGLVHRDLKPSNVMICRVALEHDFVKVLDFGLAKFVEPAGTTGLTRDTEVAGTPAYMAPEIALALSTVDARADLYSLGCVGFFLLTGTTVFEDTTPVGVALKHVQMAPDAPSTRTELTIPPDLEHLILECLQKKPENRPASARDVARRLSEIDSPRWAAEDAKDWWAIHRPEMATPSKDNGER